VDVGNDTTTGNGCLNERVQLLITANGQLQVAGGDTLHFEIFRGIASQLENLGGQIFQNGSTVDGGGGADATM